MLNKLEELIAAILTDLRSIIFSETTKEEARFKPQYFTRSRNLPFPYLLIFLMADLPGSLDSELQQFFKEISNEDKVITEPSVSESRNHFDESPFVKMFNATRDRFVGFLKENELLLHTLIYCGADGSWLSLPNIPFLGKHFGFYGRKQTSPTARMVLLYDSRLHFIFEADIGPVKVSEREMALSCTRDLRRFLDPAWTCLIFDRGFVGNDFMESLENMGFNFIIRLKDKHYGVERLKAPAQMAHFYGEGKVARFVKVLIPSGDEESLSTNLYGTPMEEFQHLYFLRWPVEIAFYFIKHVLRLGDFNGYTVNSIRQSFWIAMTLSNIASIVKMAADEIVRSEREGSDNKYEYECNLSEAITMLHTEVIKILLEEDEEERFSQIDSMVKEAARYVTPVRKERKVERRTTRKAFYHFNQKVH